MTKSKSPPSDAATTAAENEPAPASHSLLKKGEPNEILLKTYKKVEKKLAGLLKVHLSNILDCEMGVEVGDSAKLPFQDWLSNQLADSVYLEFQLGASEVPIIIRIARTFLTASVDCFFGGQFDGEMESTGELKKSEIAMIERLANSISVVLADAWSVLFETTVRFKGYVHDKDEVELEMDDDDMLVASASIELFGHTIPAIDVVQTIDGLVAIEPQLNRPNQKTTNEIDPIWKADLKDSVEQVYLPVRSVLGRPTMQLSELSRLAVGDILPVAPTDNVPLIVGDRVFAHGSIGEQNGGVAFKITQFL